MVGDAITRRSAFAGLAAGITPFVSDAAGATGSAVPARSLVTVTLAEMKAADPASETMIHDGAVFTWVSGNFAQQADSINIVASDNVSLAKGAWVRQDDGRISHRLDATARITSVHHKLRHLVLADEDFGFRSDASPAANSRALQQAVQQAQTVHLPAGADPIAFDTPVFLPPNTRIVGRGSGTRLVAVGKAAFVCEAPDGSGGELQAPWLENFDLFCAGSGIRFNRADGGYSDAGGQQAIMRPRLDRLRIRRREAGNAGSTGVEFNKCFDGVIHQCVIEGFDKGYLARGSDLIEIGGRTRISMCNTLIDIGVVVNPPYRYGSSTRVIGCDLLAARQCYIRADDFDLLVEGNYFEHSLENSALSDWAFDITARNRTRFIGNRMELQSTFFDGVSPLVPRFLKVSADPGNLFVWEDNGNDGLAFGLVEWNRGKGQRYWINATQRSRLIQRGTSGVVPLPLPFNSIDAPQEMPWRFSPSLPGLRNESYGGKVVCIDDAFVIPYRTTDEHISFCPANAPINGTVDIWIKAKSAEAGNEITLYVTKGGKFVATASQKLTKDFAWYRVFKNFSVEDLFVFILNRDSNHRQDIYLGELAVFPKTGS